VLLIQVYREGACKSLIRSCCRLTYGDAQKILDTFPPSDSASSASASGSVASSSGAASAKREGGGEERGAAGVRVLTEEEAASVPGPLPQVHGEGATWGQVRSGGWLHPLFLFHLLSVIYLFFFSCLL
jgi:hypothetical protein